MADSEKSSGAAGKKKAQLETRIVKALSHQTRVSILDLMNTGAWSPNELSRALGMGLSHISYHVQVLLNLEMIELVDTAPRRGAVEHFYRAVERPFLPSSAEVKVPKPAQRLIGNRILENIAADVAASLESGRFYERDDWHIGWTPLTFDDEACREAEELADKFAEDMIDLQAEATSRLAEQPDSEPILTSAVLLVFGSKDGALTNIPMWRRGRDHRDKGKCTKKS